MSSLVKNPKVYVSNSKMDEDDDSDEFEIGHVVRPVVHSQQPIFSPKKVYNGYFRRLYFFYSFFTFQSPVKAVYRHKWHSDEDVIKLIVLLFLIHLIFCRVAFRKPKQTMNQHQNEAFRIPRVFRKNRKGKTNFLPQS